MVWLSHSYASAPGSGTSSTRSPGAPFISSGFELNSNASLPEAEMNALYELYNATSGPNWYCLYSTNHKKWQFHAHANPCAENWEGIQCGLDVVANISHVISLDLYSCGLYGTVPDSIAQLTNLTVLALEVNALYGAFPAAIGSLEYLHVLSLSYNNFTSSLPADLGNLHRLQYLNVEKNHLTGSIPADLQRLTELFYFNVMRNRLTGSFPSWLCNAADMLQLMVGANFLHGPVPACLDNLTHLINLGLESNRFTGTIPHWLGDTGSMNITNLSLNDNLFLGTLPASIGSLQKMGYLDLSYNQLSGTIPASYLAFPQLNSLELNHNNLHGPIPSTLGDTPILMHLDLSANDLSGEIPDTFDLLPKLLQLILADNFLDGSFPTSLCAVAVQMINFGSNSLTGVIPQCIGNFTSAGDFILSDNYMHGTIPETIQELRSLLTLELSNNAFSGTVPASIGVLSILTVLLDHNHFSGNINDIYPLGLFGDMQTVLLNNNQFTGELSEHLFRQSYLSTFVASTNCITGTVPATVCHASLLTSLVLDGLTSATSCRQNLLPESSTYTIRSGVGGTVPECIYQMPALRTLQLSGNQITGTLPASINLGSSLIDISLSHNALVGSIPANFQRKSWHSLDLSFNKLSGTLSADLFHNKTMYFVYEVNPFNHRVKVNFTSYRTNVSGSNPALYLNNNRLSGVIPGSVHQLVNISMLGTNAFECQLDGSDLPVHDSARDNYQCASTEFDLPYYVWMGLCLLFAAVASAVTFGVVKNKLWNNCMQNFAVLDSLPETFTNAFASVLSSVQTIMYMSIGGTVYAVLVLLPLYAVLSYHYSTMTYEYAWTVSAAFLSGVVPVAWEFPFLVVAAAGPVVYLTSSRKTTFVAPSKEANEWLVIALYFAVNTVVVTGVNIAYVYITIYESSEQLVLAQILMAFFKFYWSCVCMDIVLRWIVALVHRSAATNTVPLKVMTHTTLAVTCSVFNNIIIPCLIVLCISPNCFYNVFASANSVHSTFTYFAIREVRFDAITILPYVGRSSYSPPFQYRYQCSSSFITYYAPAFMNTCIVGTFVVPAVQYVLHRLYQRQARGSHWYKLVTLCTPRIMKLPTQSTEYLDSTLFLPNRLISVLVTSLTLLFTFGIVFPPLAVALAVSVVAIVYYTKLNVGRYLVAAREVHILDKVLAVIERECEATNCESVLSTCIWLLVTVSCWFHTLFLFDTLGDAVGFDEAYWVLIVMPLMPACVYGLHRAYLLMLFRSADARQPRSKEGPDTRAAAQMELGSVDKSVSDFDVVNLLHDN